MRKIVRERGFRGVGVGTDLIAEGEQDVLVVSVEGNDMGIRCVAREQSKKEKKLFSRRKREMFQSKIYAS